jgi:hypothetical protein
LTYASTDYSASGSTTFSKNTSGFTTFTVAGNTMVVDVEMWGAGGGAQKSSTGGDGSAGGYSKARLSLPAGEYAFLVGAGGHAGGGGTSARAFPDGGKYTGTRTDGASGAGGGGSTRLGLKISDGITLADSSTYDTTASFNNSTYNGYILISGGGAGSAAYINQGLDNAASTNPDYGVGGGLKGGDGSLYWSSDGVSTLGFGGTQSEGGAAGTGGRDTGTVAEAGGKYYGANGEGAGAGGGYYGGGGSQGYYSQAGGGSGYIDSSYCVAGQDNFTAINGGQNSSTYYDNTVADATYPNAGEGPATDDTAGYDGLFKLTVIS